MSKIEFVMESTSYGNRNSDDGDEDDEDESKYCFTKWMTQQQDDLKELKRAMEFDSGDDVKLRAVVERVLGHFQDYLDNVSQMERYNAPGLVVPWWCRTFDKSDFWMGGCRATICIRLVEGLCGFKSESAILMGYLQGVRKRSIGWLTYNQFNLMNTLLMNTLIEEDRISSEMASLEESNIEEQMMLMSITNCSNVLGEPNEGPERARQMKAMEMGKKLKEADQLRLNTLKELLTNILKPIQSVELVLASNQLYLSLHECSDFDYEVYKDGVFHPTPYT